MMTLERAELTSCRFHHECENLTSRIRRNLPEWRRRRRKTKYGSVVKKALPQNESKYN